jgi:hypothetical protein
MQICYTSAFDLYIGVKITYSCNWPLQLPRLALDIICRISRSERNTKQDGLEAKVLLRWRKEAAPFQLNSSDVAFYAICV